MVDDGQGDDRAGRYLASLCRPQHEQERQPSGDHRDEPDHDQHAVGQPIEEHQVREHPDRAVALALGQHRMERGTGGRSDQRDGRRADDRGGDRPTAGEPPVHRALQGLYVGHVRPSLREAASLRAPPSAASISRAAVVTADA